MKSCQQCNYIFKGAETECLACGLALVEVAAPPGVSADGTPLIYCPRVGCGRLLASQQDAKFCDRCASPLVPASLDLWKSKVVAPALDEKLVGVLQGSPDLLRSAFEMGLPEAEAEAVLDRAFIDKTGVGRRVLEDWLNESVMPLGKQRSADAATVQKTFERANEINIKPTSASTIMKHFVSWQDTATGQRQAAPHRAATSTTEEIPGVQSVEDASAKATGTAELSQASASAAYKMLVSDGSPGHEVIYLSAAGGSAMGKLQDKNVYLVEDSTHGQGAFVLFPSNAGGWVFPNPALRYRASALRPLFPELTEEQFDTDKGGIEPRAASKLSDGRWCVEEEEGAALVPVILHGGHDVGKRQQTQTVAEAGDDDVTLVPPMKSRRRDDRVDTQATKYEVAPVVIVEPPVKRLSTFGWILLVGIVFILGGIAVVLLQDNSPRETASIHNDNGGGDGGTTSDANTQTDSTDVPPVEASPASSPGEVGGEDEASDGNVNAATDEEGSDEDNLEDENPSDTKATLTLVVETDGASVTVDGNPLPRTSSNTLNLTPGRHVVRATLPGHKPWENTIYLNPQDRVRLPIELEELAGRSIAETVTVPAPRPPTAEKVAAHRRNAEYHLGNGNLDAAMNEVEAGLSVEPRDPPLQSMRSRIAAAQQILSRKNSLPGARTNEGAAQPPSRASSDRAATLTFKPQPACPEHVKAAKKCDTVFVEVVFNERGVVHLAKPISGPKELYAVAVSAALQSRFQPGMRNGQPVSGQAKLPFMFNPR